jgi:hypothetical protein
VTIAKIILGPSSKYDDDIPYTYEARYRIIDGLEDYNAYFSDTVCGLIRFLIQKGHNPNNIELYEIYRDREISINPSLYARDGNNWLVGIELCRSFRKIYPDHIGSDSCKFNDRSRLGLG